MVYEKRLRSFKDLAKEIRSLELDGGIRIQGKYDGKRSLIFVTKPAGKYAVAVYTTKPTKSTEAMGKRTLIREFDDSSQVERFLTPLIKRSVEAYSY